VGTIGKRKERKEEKGKTDQEVQWWSLSDSTLSQGERDSEGTKRVDGESVYTFLLQRLRLFPRFANKKKGYNEGGGGAPEKIRFHFPGWADGGRV